MTSHYFILTFARPNTLNKKPLPSSKYMALCIFNDKFPRASKLIHNFWQFFQVIH